MTVEPMETAPDRDCFDVWDRFCDDLKNLGHGIRAAEHPDPADGLRHLGRLAVFALQAFVEHGDPDFPKFQRFDDDLTKWGGPNIDNSYLRARVRGDSTYRLTGNVAGMRGLILSLVEGDMQLGQYGVYEEWDLDRLGAGPDGDFEVLISATPQPGTWMPMDPRTRYVSIRQYFSDWDTDPVGDFRIERVGAEGLAPGPLTPARLAEQLTEAHEWVTKSLPYWERYMRRRAEELDHNHISTPSGVPGGAHGIRYASTIWDLGPDEALLIEAVPARARYWSMQLYTMPWFESLDIANRQNGLTGHQVQVDDDGVCRIVVAHTDPGVPNWLDTEGRRNGMIACRWIGAESVPAPETRVVALADLAGHLPPSTPWMDSAARRASIARRQAHIARRFRR